MNEGCYLGQAKKKIGSQATFFQIRWGRQVFFFYFQSNIRHMCSTLLKTSFLLFGMLVSSAYGSGNDVLREEVNGHFKSTTLALHRGGLVIYVQSTVVIIVTLFDQIKP